MKPPYNLIISNVPGPRTTQYFNGMRLESAPTRCRSRSTGWRSTSPATPTPTRWRFGLTGCRRTVPHLQRLLTHLDSELDALERAAGI